LTEKIVSVTRIITQATKVWGEKTHPWWLFYWDRITKPRRLLSRRSVTLRGFFMERNKGGAVCEVSSLEETETPDLEKIRRKEGEEKFGKGKR